MVLLAANKRAFASLTKKPYGDESHEIVDVSRLRHAALHGRSPGSGSDS